MTTADRANEARQAVADGEWRRALDLLADDLDGLDTAEHLELSALAAYGAGEFEVSISAWEDLHRHELAAGRTAEASRAAAMVAMYLMIDTGLMAAVRGWLRRAESLLVGAEEGPTHAVIAMVRTYERLMCGDVESAGRNAATAVELGDRLGVIPATVVGRVATARVHILNGEIDEGVELLDEVAVLLLSPDVDPLTTGMVYCELICAAQGLALHDRAAEWTDMMERWRPGEAIGGIGGRCRVHRAEMLRMSGPCELAEKEALTACEELRPWMRREFGWPLDELGTIRLRKGDLDGAEAAFVEAHAHGWFPQPGLALLHLERGDVDGARELIVDAVRNPVDIPSKERPPFGDLRLAPLLEAMAEIAAAAGDGELANDAATRLRSIAQTYPSRGLDAAAHLAEARAALLAGEPERASESAATAVTGWADLGAPFEMSTARLVLAEALRRAGSPERARLELDAAASGFEGFGARRHVDRVHALTAAPLDTDDTVSGVVAAETAVFRQEGRNRRILFGGVEVVVPDLKGLRYVERLVAEPNREFHVLDLVGTEEGHTGERPSSGRSLDLPPPGPASGLPVLDDQARRAYQRRLADVEEDIEEARHHNDPGRLELAERDRAYLIAELQRAVGLGGRSRTTGGAAERARKSMARTIRYALQRVGEQHPSAGAHLQMRIRTGTYCSYVTDPLVALEWRT